MLIHDDFDKNIQIEKNKRIVTNNKEYKTRYDFDKCYKYSSKKENDNPFEKHFKYLVDEKINEEQ